MCIHVFIGIQKQENVQAAQYMVYNGTMLIYIKHRKYPFCSHWNALAVVEWTELIR